MNATFFLANFLVFSVILVTGQCPNSTWIRRGNKCYFVKEEKADLFENIALCNQLNASLVSIVDDDENFNITEITSGREFWLGLGFKANASEDLYWFDERPFVYNSWKYGSMSTGYKYWAAYLKEGEWFVDSAFDRYYQMCSINLDRTTPYKKTPNPAEIKETLVTKECPNSTWTRRGNKCYFFKREEADLYENIALCNQLNASLISITNEAENIQVSRLILPSDSLWLGLGKKSIGSNDFYWFDGSPFVFNSWREETRNGNHKYWAANFLKGKWFGDAGLAFDRSFQMCSINLKASTSYKETPNPADIKENLIAKQCPNSTWIRRGNKCYFVKEENADLFENIALCNQLNASMVSIINEAENIQVSRLISSRSFFRSLWLGLGQRSNHSKKFYWFDGNSFEYSSWGSKPGNTNHKYWAAYLRNGQWYDDFPHAFSHYYQVCSINLKPSTSYSLTRKAADIQEILVAKECPNSKWMRRANKCYFVRRKLASLYENIALCNQLNASLISITNEAENIHVSRLISPYRSLWLGIGQKSIGSKDFYWFDGSPFAYNSWRGEPNVTYKYFGAYFERGEWITGLALMANIQVCQLDLTLNISPKKTPIPAEFKDIPGQCPNTSWRKMGSKCIFFDTKTEITYKENQALCKKMNATMVSIHSETEHIYLSTLSRGYAFWIGFKQTSRKDKLYEWEDGSPKNYEIWDKTELRDSGTKYWAAYSHDGKWFETRSYLKKYPACQTFLLTEGENLFTETTNLEEIN